MQSIAMAISEIKTEPSTYMTNERFFSALNVILHLVGFLHLGKKA